MPRFGIRYLLRTNAVNQLSAESIANSPAGYLKIIANARASGLSPAKLKAKQPTARIPKNIAGRYFSRRTWNSPNK